jgi:hypothetical protein
MLVEPLDNKSECVGYYCEGQILKEIPELIESWNYHPSFGLDGEFAYLYCKEDISKVCPDIYKNEWKHVNDRMKAYFRSFVISKVNLDHNCIFDMIPQQFLIKYYEVKTQIVSYILSNYSKPHDYDYLLQLSQVLADIRSRPLNIDTDCLTDKKQIKKYQEIDPYIKYEIFGTKTGRLSTQTKSFPILQLDKTHRSILTPTNDWFVELDYNGAEVRTFLALAGVEQPEIDIHQWNANHIYNGSKDREEAKVAFLAWLYGETKNDKAEEIYNKQKVLQKYWNGEKITTFYNMEIPADSKHAVNYLIQSTFAQLALRQMIKVFNFLKGRKSYIAFTVHDNIVIDLAQEDKKDLKQIIDIYSNTDLGKFKVNLKAGVNYGELKKF